MNRTSVLPRTLGKPGGILVCIGISVDFKKTAESLMNLIKIVVWIITIDTVQFCSPFKNVSNV